MTSRPQGAHACGHGFEQLLAQAVAHGFRRRVEPVGGTLGEVLRQQEARVADHRIEVVFEQAFQGPGPGAFAGIEAGIEVDLAGLLDMAADEGRIGDQHAIVREEGQLALGRGIGGGLLLGVGEAGHLELDLGLDGKGADLGQAETGAGTEQDEGRRHGISPC